MHATSRPAARRALGAGDRRALAALVGAPLVVFVLPALLGYPLATGDNVVQNYPLRAFAGALLRHGHLPLYDPFVSSGSALLGGINAGAAFPGVLLFVALPPLAAWVATEVAAYAAAAVGVFVLCRLSRLAPLPSALGAASFAFAGFLSSQAVHIGVVESGACLAWLLVGIERIAHAPRPSRPAWVALAAASAACLGLAGSPDVAFYASLGAAVYAGHLVLHARGSRTRVAAAFLTAAVTGILLAGVQLATGAAVVATSQRADVGAAFLTAGSLDWGQLTTLIAPHLLGGGPVGLRSYVGSYNLAEIDAYPGMLALVAVASLAARWRSPDASRWRVWYLVGAVGLLVAVGGATPLPHLLAHVPVVGSSRLPSRALVLVALSCSVLLAHYADGMLTRHDPGRRRLAGLVAPLAALALLLATVVGGRPVASRIAGGPVGPWSLAAIAPWLVPFALVAVAAAALVLVSGSLDPRARARALVAIALVDLLLFTVDQSSLAPTYASALAQPSSRSEQLARVVGRGQRFVVVDPSRSGGTTLDELGVPDLSSLSGVPSAQGYSSLVWGPYARATGTHGQDVVSASAVAGTALDSLGVSTLLVTRTSFLVPAPTASVPVAPTVLGIGPGSGTTRLFGGAVQVATVRISSPRGEHLSPAQLGALARSLRLVGATGALEARRPAVTVGPTSAVAGFDPDRTSAGIAVSDPLATTVSRLALVVTTASGEVLTPTGPLSRAATPPHWRPDGTIGPYAVLHDTRAAPPYRLVSSAAVARGARPKRPVAGAVRVLRDAPDGTSATVSVDSTVPVTLVRSVADIPGWTATITHDGTTTSRPVGRLGVVSAVRLAAGRSLVRFSYAAPGLDAGLAASAAGLALLLGLVALALSRRRRPGATGGSGPGSAPLVTPVLSPARPSPRVPRSPRRKAGASVAAPLVALAALAAVAGACGGATVAGARPDRGALSPGPAPRPVHGAPRRPARPGLRAHRVTVVGDSVLLDYSSLLSSDVPGASIVAAVGRQWLSGVALVRSLRAAGELGSTVVVALGTNGPVTNAGFEQMMAALAGTRRVVLVTVHVDRPWQQEVNAVLRSGARRYPRAVVADWATLASSHPGWFYPDGTHLPTGGPGAHALASLVS
ncbi:MAG: hypothetical protein M0Z33_04135, partial [Actinomycetota bacterium]|nr:hypothetical protein [Actinomycetota bacterium]